MGSVMFTSRRVSESKSCRTPVRSLQFALGLTVMFCGVIAVQGGIAQTTRQNSSGQDATQAPDQSGDANAWDSGDQGTGQSGNVEDLRQPSTHDSNVLPSSDEGFGSQNSSQNSKVDRSARGEAGPGNSNCRAPAQSGRAADSSSQAPESPTQNGCVQVPNQSIGGQAKGPRATPVQMGDKADQDETPQIQQKSPYGDLESLRELYTQIPSTGAKLQRFGSDALLLGTGNSDELPMDLPAGPDYVLGPGDGLVVNIWGSQSGRLERIIDRQGQIELPETGTLMISGMTIAQAQIAIQGALSKQFQKERVEISLGRLRTVRVYVVGDVQMPGAYDVSSLSTALSALYAAGGPTSRGSLRVLRQYRGKQLVREIDLYDFLLKGVRSDIERLLPGDTLLVPPVGPSVTVEGMVHRPAIYELNGEKTLSQILDLAGGTLTTASLKQINVRRVVANQRHTMLSLQLPDNSTEVARKLGEFQVQGGDDVIISQILPYNQDAVYLEGHVYRPGPYPYRDGMTISDLLRSYQDIMPEPANHAELVRLQPPDFRPETISLNLPDVLIGNDSIPLQPFDLIRIYGRYEIDSPRVTIDGEVLRPGTYPMSQGMTLTKLVKMAGGFNRSAYRDGADLSSYIVQDGQKVLVNNREVAVQKALDGDKSADAVLKPGDVVSIRRLAGWQDIGATVTISGEVEHPGNYGVATGERLSSVLKRAGGFRNEAYPYAAVLERVQVRELNEQARQQMIRRIEETPVVVDASITTGGQTSADIQKSLESQRQQILIDLRSHPALGRLVINITTDIDRWANTSADIEMRAGDTLFIPKRPSFVMASGQVYNPVAISYVPGKTLGWYFHKSGGATPQGNKKQIYILRADGTVVPIKGRGWGGGDFMDLHMRPGDTIFVPERIVGASQVWQNIVGTAQVISAITLPLAFAGVL
jgi:protein involved in polysaccharide export with SLBB domain